MPGVDAREFYPAEKSERDELRAKIKWDAGDWAVGVMAMNQGRKAIPAMLEGYADFALGKPNARLLLDMDKASPAGWVQVPLFNTVAFTAAGTATPMDGDTLTQGPATATIQRVMISSGTIAGVPGLKTRTA